MLDYLEVTEEATLKIGKEAHWCDNNPGVSSTQLANIIKSFHRPFPAKTDLMLKWAGEAFDALRYQLNMPFVGEGGEYTVLTYFQAMVEKGWYKDRACNTGRIVRLLETSIKNSKANSSERTYYTELNFIVQAMQRSGRTHAHVYEWLTTAFNCMTKDEVLFNEALKEVGEKRSRYTVSIKPANGEHPYLRMCFLHTDNPMALAAANFARQQIVVLRNTQNQVQIFIDKRSGHNLDVVIGMMRWMEASPEMREQISFHDMCGTSGNMACAQHIHYKPEAGQILNGSPTHPDVPATKLASQTIVDIVCQAFHPVLISRWMRDHSVRKKKA